MIIVCNKIYETSSWHTFAVTPLIANMITIRKWKLSSVMLSYHKSLQCFRTSTYKNMCTNNDSWMGCSVEAGKLFSSDSQANLSSIHTWEIIIYQSVAHIVAIWSDYLSLGLEIYLAFKVVWVVRDLTMTFGWLILCEWFNLRICLPGERVCESMTRWFNESIVN